MKTFKPTKKEVNYWVKETLDHWNATFEENRPPKLKQLQANFKMMEAQLKEKSNDDFYAHFPTGECNRELKTRFEATKIVLQKIAE